ncbi:MAG: hypothetical protein ACHQF4_00375 [Sphingobacteriales bacterium]
MASSLFIFYVLLFYCFVFKTNWIINKLKLDKGYEHELFEFNIPYSTILKVSIIIISGVLFLEVAPDLIREILIYFNVSTLKKTEFNRNVAYIITDSIKIVIALLLIIYSTSITRYIGRNDKKTAIEVIPEQD